MIRWGKTRRRFSSRRSGAGAIRAPYTGLVANRGHLPNRNYGTGISQVMTRTAHTAVVGIASLKLGFAGFSNLGVNLPGNCSVTAAIEYPVSTFTQVKFSTAVTGTIIPGAVLQSDATTISIPQGAKFYIRIWQSDAVNGVTVIEIQNAFGDNDTLTNWGATTADLTMGGAMSTQANNWNSCIVIGQTTGPTIAIIGDSRTQGFQDVGAEVPMGEGGLVRPALVNKAYVDFSQGATNTTHYTAVNGAKMIALAQSVGFTHLYNGLGINDLDNNALTSAALITAQQQVKTDWGGKPMTVVTLDPHTTSTDAWATTVNQTVANASANTQRLAYNAAVRANPAWALAVFDPATITESSLNSGLWTANYTTDGLHGNHTSYAALLAGNIVNPAVFV